MLERICTDMKIISCAARTVKLLDAVKKAVCVAGVIYVAFEAARLIKQIKTQ